ncbi:polymorphic toxin-type HINT domain-containing protein [Actinomadura namibiensis]|uniref:Hint domain-containing protein n=1 Tax=Actinomadura namibiensis TaxID=182080 RepID=A0A7W3QJ35_ACTNM|nr:polymorphic toxin-type HINT domain-containing protein [Actinomadura namibiensis]MBA8948538.1 hypothetical protein [Actinomadura namibiensis]
MILLVGAVLAAVTVVAIPEQISAGIRAGICRVTGDKNCDKPGSKPGSPNPGASPTNQQASVPPGQEAPEQREYREALDALNKADLDLKQLEKEWNEFDLLKEIGKLGLDFLAGDIIKCVEKPNFSDCLWALVGIIPWGKIGKLLKSIPKIVKLIDRFLDLKRRLDKARNARKNAQKRLDDALDACKKKAPNSFVAGTPVLMADGTRKPIERVRVGDLVWATDPVTGHAGSRKVTHLITGEGRKHLVDLTIDLDGELGGPNARITATAEHPFWVPDADAWIHARGLVPTDRLHTPDGRRTLVLRTEHRKRTTRVHNLTVEGLHTYYVTARSVPVLVHNENPDPNACQVGTPKGDDPPGVGDTPLTGGTKDDPVKFTYESPAKDLAGRAKPDADELEELQHYKNYPSGSEEHMLARWKHYKGKLSWEKWRNNYIANQANRHKGKVFEDEFFKRNGFKAEDGWVQNHKANTNSGDRDLDLANPAKKIGYELKSGKFKYSQKDIDKEIELIKQGWTRVYVFAVPPSANVIKKLEAAGIKVKIWYAEGSVAP